MSLTAGQGELKYLHHYSRLDFSNDFLGKEMPIHLQLPYPIHKPFHDAMDLIEKFNKDAKSYDQKVKLASKQFNAVEDKVMAQNFHETYAQVPEHILNLYNQEPCNKPFPCDYNPYYATGLLDVNRNYLLRVDKNNNLRCNNLDTESATFKIALEAKKTPVRGLQARYLNGSLILLLRHECEVGISAVDIDGASSQLRFQKSFRHPVLDVKWGNDKLGFTFANSNFVLFDFANQKQITSDAFKSHYLKCEFYDDNSVALLNHKSVTFVDFRSSGDHPVLQPEFDACNDFTCFKVNDNTVYVGTRHVLVRADRRFLGKNEYCSHLMRFSPCFIETTANLLCLSGQTAERTLFSGDPISSLPLGVPTITDTFEKCALEKGIVLREGLQARLDKSTAGIKFVQQNNDTFLYSVNSVGEIFKQKISYENDCNDKEPIEALHKWLRKIPAPPKSLHVTNVVNLGRARVALNRKILESNLQLFEENNETQFLNRFKNEYALEKFGDLALNVPGIWSDEDDDGDVIDKNVPEVDSHDKVFSWINSSYLQ